MTHRNMSSQNHRFRLSDDEEEDLEALRLEALKTLHKKEGPNMNPLYVPTSPSPHIRNMMHSSMNPPYGMLHMSNNMYNNNNTMRIPNNNKTNLFYPTTHNLPPSRLITNTIDTFSNRQRHEKIDLNEPYVPQHVPPPGIMGGGVASVTNANGWIPEATSTNISNSYVPYVPHKINDPIRIGVGNVQLSPRSLAFVAKNNDILMKRKVENLSPNYSRGPCKSPDYYSSPSPSPYRQSSDRWSHSPPPKLKSKSRSPINRGNNNRNQRYVHRRSHSRSPVIRQRSPVFRRMSVSRSPPPKPKSRHSSPQSHHRYISRSPPPVPVRRVNSRSPLPQNVRHKPSPRRHLSRSPIIRHGRPVSRSPLNTMNGRRRSPQHPPRYNNKLRRSVSPHGRRSPPHPNHDSTETNMRQNIRARSPPPLPPPPPPPPPNIQQNTQMHRRSMSPRRRSPSRSPTRKYIRRSRERVVPNPVPIRRRSPYNNGRRRYDGPMNGFRNRPRKRTPSPLNDRRKRPRMRSVERQRKDDNRRIEKTERRPEEHLRNERFESRTREPFGDRLNNLKSMNGGYPMENKTKDKDKMLEMNNSSKEANLSSPSLKLYIKRDEKTVDKVNNQKESQLPPVQIEEKLESSDDDDDDGIDLFPSDESESENEGRFKSSTSRNERNNQMTTVSFTKLGEPPTPSIIKDLKDFGGDNRGNKSDRERNRRNYDKRRDDRFRKSDNNRNRDRGKGSNSSTFTLNSSNRREREESNRSEDKQKNEKPMFKSTFQAVESEVNRTNTKTFVDKDKEGTERKSNTILKRTTYNKEKKDSVENEITNEHVQSAVLSLSTASSGSSTSSTSSSSSSSNAGLSGKKPIHLRLGAMTNTFKAPKKSQTPWNTTSSEKV